MISLLVGLIVFSLFAYLAWWTLSLIPLPQPVRVVVTVLFMLICLFILYNYIPLDLPRGRLR